jgi:hypothetical protein
MQNQKLSCPLCSNQEVIKFGFVYSRTLKTYGQKLAQVYQCKKCLTKFAPEHQRRISFFPKWLRDFAREEIQKDPMLSCQDIADMVDIKFHIPVDSTIIYNWITITGNIKIEYRLKKNWRNRRKRFGKSGMSKKWFEKRRVAQRQLWEKEDYRKYMSEVHKHPQHSKEVVAFCLSLKDSGLSLRAIAREANAKFGLKITHDTVAKWLQNSYSTAINNSEIATSFDAKLTSKELTQ